ncbi:MAG: MEDS domain-containing protein [Nitrososphaeraceae archaeon]
MFNYIGNNYEISNNYKKKTILLVTDNIQHYQQEFNNYNINNYKVTFVNWDDILTFITNSYGYTKRKNLELIILDISMLVGVEYTKINKLNTITTITEIKKIFYDKRIFFLIPSSQSMIETIVLMKICKQENIIIQPFSVFDVIDLISTIKKKERLYQIQLHDHVMYTYSSTEDQIKDIIKFLKIGIKNNEVTLLLLDKDIQESSLKSQMVLHDIDINKLQNNGMLKIIYSEDWYFSTKQKNNINNKNKVSIDRQKIYDKLIDFADQAIKNEGKKGLRIFGMIDCFFEHCLVDELVDYDCMIPPKFNKPILAICTYKEKHIKQLSDDQIRRLVLTHTNVRI